jgi:hypothetical protein
VPNVSILVEPVGDGFYRFALMFDAAHDDCESGAMSNIFEVGGGIAYAGNSRGSDRTSERRGNLSVLQSG